ncbi:hypothetical protein [Entomobacter blattae]|nr:hypothetical protein [Entomobacter blattae]
MAPRCHYDDAPMVIAQIKAQLNRLVPVYKVANLSLGGKKSP